MHKPTGPDSVATGPHDRYARGLDILMGLSPQKMDIVTNRLAEVAPDFARTVIEYAFGEIFARETLDLHSRELIAVAALTARGDSIAQLRAHVSSALMLGLSRAEVVEAMTQVSIYAGFPVVITALTECHDLLTAPPDPACATCPPDQRTEVGQS